MVLLEFEKPIGELQEQLAKVKQIAEKSGVDVSKTVVDLETKIENKRREIFENLTPWQRVQLSRHPDRPYTLSYINAITDNTWIELYGDRNVKDDKAMV